MGSFATPSSGTQRAAHVVGRPPSNVDLADGGGPGVPRCVLGRGPPVSQSRCWSSSSNRCRHVRQRGEGEPAGFGRSWDSLNACPTFDVPGAGRRKPVLGKQTLCQLSYSRSGGSGTSPCAGEVTTSKPLGVTHAAEAATSFTPLSAESNCLRPDRADEAYGKDQRRFPSVGKPPERACTEVERCRLRPPVRGPVWATMAFTASVTHDVIQRFSSLRRSPAGDSTARTNPATTSKGASPGRDTRYEPPAGSNVTRVARSLFLPARCERKLMRPALSILRLTPEVARSTRTSHSTRMPSLGVVMTHPCTVCPTKPTRPWRDTRMSRHGALARDPSRSPGRDGIVGARYAPKLC